MSPTIRRYRTHQKSLSTSIPVIAVKFPNFYRTLYDSYSFTRVANFRFFTHWCIFICSSLFSLFRTSPRFLTWSMFTYKLIELHLRPKMLGSQNNNVDELRSQFVTSVEVIPAKIVSVDCIRATGLSIKRQALISGENVKPPFLREY